MFNCFGLYAYNIIRVTVVKLVSQIVLNHSLISRKKKLIIEFKKMI